MFASLGNLVFSYSVFISSYSFWNRFGTTSLKTIVRNATGRKPQTSLLSAATSKRKLVNRKYRKRRLVFAPADPRRPLSLPKFCLPGFFFRCKHLETGHQPAALASSVCSRVTFTNAPTVDTAGRATRGEEATSTLLFRVP